MLLLAIIASRRMEGGYWLSHQATQDYSLELLKRSAGVLPEAVLFLQSRRSWVTQDATAEAWDVSFDVERLAVGVRG